MKNILSYHYGTQFTGQEIKDWIDFHSSHVTSHTKQAFHMNHFYSNIKQGRKYKIRTKPFDPHGSVRYQRAHPYPEIIRI